MVHIILFGCYYLDMNIGNRFRLYPDKEQQQVLVRWIGCQRFIYNAKVLEDRYFRKFASKSVSLAGEKVPVDQQYSRFKTELTPWLSEVPSQVLRNGEVRWKQSYQRFFKGIAKRPKLHSRRGKQSVWLTSEIIRFVKDGGKDCLFVGRGKFKVGLIPFAAHNEFNIPKSVNIVLDGCRWYVTFSFDDGLPEPKDEDIAEWLSGFSEEELLSRTKGIDRNVKHNQIMTSAEEAFDFSGIQKQRMIKYARYKKRWQKSLSRRTKGSRRYGKAKAKISRYGRYAKNVRRDTAHKSSRILVDDPNTSLFVLEDLKIKNMTKSAKGTVDNHGRNVRQKAGLNRAILESYWGMFDVFMSYKARRNGKLTIKVAPHYSSQECSACGYVHKDNRPEQAVFVCLRCNHQENADSNAGKVLAKRGVTKLLSGQWQPKKVKHCSITKKVGTGCSKPAAMQPTLAEIAVSHTGVLSGAPWSLKRETPTITA